MKTKLLIPEFVEYIPDHKGNGVLYISMKYCIAVHKCACGCGCEVITPLGVKDWQLYFNGETITLTPSIGNWKFECRSHYWIRNNQVVQVTGYSEKAQNKHKKKSLWKRIWTILG